MRIQEQLQQHNYTFYIIDPSTGEFTKYGSGAPFQIIRQLADDPENSRIADVIKQQHPRNTNGVLSFTYDDHIYAFIPNN